MFIAMTAHKEKWLIIKITENNTVTLFKEL